MSEVQQERVKHPGYHWTVTPTHDWDEAEGPFHWSRYYRPDADGFCLRESGFTDTWDRAAAQAVVEL